MDARSDLYSLGVVMYEMLTGKPPYDGESPVAIAIQHINATPVPPRQLNSSIPLGLQQITLHAMCSDLSARYASATAMIEDLEALRKNPQVVFRFNAGPGGTTAYVDARQVVSGAAAAAAAGAAVNSARMQQQKQPVSRQPNPQQRQARPAQPPQSRPVDAQQAARQKARTMAEKSVQRANQEKQSRRQGDYSGGYYEDEDEETEESGHSKTAIIVVSILLAVVVIAGIVMWKVFLSPTDDGMVSVPDFLGQKIENVLGNEMYSDFNLEEGDSVYSSKYDEGEICEQSVRKGQKVTKGTTIKLTVSKGTQTAEMPDLRGYTTQQVADAMSDLISQLSISLSYSYEESEDVEEGKVISTDPAAGANLNAGDSVNIVVSSGVGTVMTTVPDVMDLEEADAVSMLESKNLKVSITYVENDADAGLVFYQSIKSGNEVPEGTVVSIKVSLGREEEPSPSPSEKPEETPTPTPYTPTPTPTPTPEPPEESPVVSEEPPETSPAE